MACHLTLYQSPCHMQILHLTGYACFLLQLLDQNSSPYNSQTRGETNARLDFPLSETCGPTLNSHRMGWGRGGSQFTCMFLFISWVQIRKGPGFPDKVQMLPTSYKNSLPHKDCIFQDGRNLTRSTVGQNLKGTAQGNSGLPGICAAFKGAVVHTAVKLGFPT